MATRLADRLSAARRRLFVGRAAELALFQAILEEDPFPVHILYIYGPGGIGKTSLLNEFSSEAAAAGAAVFPLDARNFEPTPETFLAALSAAIGPDSQANLLHHLANLPGRAVILVDTAEILAPLEDWLTRSFLPQLPQNTLMALAGRNPPNPAWRVDPGWQDLVKVIALRNLSRAETLDYLTRRAIPPGQHDAVLDFTHGHPLAISLVAELFAQRPGVHFQPADSPDIVKTLLEQFVQKVPGPAHRSALEACALVHTTTEALLAEMLGMADPGAGQGVHELFEWLRGLSFIESRRVGLFPHDLAREALVADLRWRNPDWYAELHRRARAYYIKRLGQSTGLSQQATLSDYIFLHRDNPIVRPFFEWQQAGGLLPDTLKPGDVPHICAMVEAHEGPQSARLAEYWLMRQPSRWLVVRDPEQKPLGFLFIAELTQATPADLAADAAMGNAAAYLQRHAPLRSGEVANHFRFWMANDTYQAISPTQTLILVNMVLSYLTTPGLAFTFFPVADAEFWGPLAAYANLLRLPEADYQVEGRAYGAFGHDWRVEPPLAWLGMLAEREIAMTGSLPAPARPAIQLLVLSQDEFAGAVQAALRQFSIPDGLIGNPLLRSRLVVEKAGASASETTRSEQLHSQMRAIIDSLQATPRLSKLHRALYHTYIQPAPTQELAAEIMDVPFSTYRRHLKEGVQQVIERLWQQEIGA